MKVREITDLKIECEPPSFVLRKRHGESWDQVKKRVNNWCRILNPL